MFKNLNCEKFLNFNQKEDSVNLGNPILDVFYEAYEKFGEYVDYENDERDINLYHLTNIKEKKIQTYAKELKIPNHIHHIWKKEKGLELFYSFKILVDPKTFMKVVLTRIPLQLCTLEDGNISPMIRGKR